MLRLHYFAALAIAAPLVAQTPERHTLRGTRVAIYDLVGDVRIVEGTGRDVVVEVTRQGSDASQLRVETGDIGAPTLRVFPSTESVTATSTATTHPDLRVLTTQLRAQDWRGRSPLLLWRRRGGQTSSCGYPGRRWISRSGPKRLAEERPSISSQDVSPPASRSAGPGHVLSRLRPEASKRGYRGKSRHATARKRGVKGVSAQPARRYRPSVQATTSR